MLVICLLRLPGFIYTFQGVRTTPPIWEEALWKTPLPAFSHMMAFNLGVGSQIPAGKKPNSLCQLTSWRDSHSVL
jgi:hypothetical protein